MISIIEVDNEYFIIRAPTLKQLREDTTKLIIQTYASPAFEIEIKDGNFAAHIPGYIDLFKQSRAKFLEYQKTQIHNGVPGARGNA